MMDPVSFQRIAEIRQQEYLAIANYERNAPPLGSSLMHAVKSVVAFGKRLMHSANTAPTQPAPDFTEACVEC
jgi:hypothetical protein